MIHTTHTRPVQCVGSASGSASDKPAVSSASAGPLPTGADALASASASASPTHDARTTIHTTSGLQIHTDENSAAVLDDLDDDDPYLVTTSPDDTTHWILKTHVVAISSRPVNSVRTWRTP